MASSIENIPISRRKFLGILKDTATGVMVLGSLGAVLEACSQKSPETPTPKNSPEIIGIPVVLEMPFGSKFIIETISPHPRLNVNKTLIEKLLHETVEKPTAPIKVSLYPVDWLRIIEQNNTLEGINEEKYQSLTPKEKETFKNGFTTTVYDPNSGIPQGVAVHISAGRFLRAARRGQSITIQNEFLPEGIRVDPIVDLNVVFYHEIRYHALLRNNDYRKQDEAGRVKEELAARKGETEWVKNLVSKGTTLRNDQLFLVPY